MDWEDFIYKVMHEPETFKSCYVYSDIVDLHDRYWQAVPESGQEHNGAWVKSENIKDEMINLFEEIKEDL